MTQESQPVTPSAPPSKRQLLLELRLRQQQADKAGAALKQRTNQAEAPASFSQEALWFLDRLLGPSALYNAPVAVRLHGALDRRALEQALNMLVERHASLRTSFEERDGVAVQRVQPSAIITLPIIDLAASGELPQVLLASAMEPFDLGSAPLLRARLWRAAADDHVLLLNIHHIISDGWSRGVMVRDLNALYGASLAGAGSPLPQLSIDFADYALWQRDRLQGARLEVLAGYWRQKLAGLQPLQLPGDRARPAQMSYRGATHRFLIPPALSGQLKALALAHNATLFMVLLAAFNVLLLRLSGQDDQAIGCPVARRDHPELEGLIGYFTNTLVFRTDLSGNPSFEALLARVRQTSLEAFANEELPSDRLVEILRLPSDLSRNALYQVGFVLQNLPDAELRLPGLRTEPLAVDTAMAKADLWLSLVEVDDGLSGSMAYSTDLFDAATIERYGRHFLTLLASVVAAPEQAIGALPLLEAEERQRILVDWNDTARDYPLQRCTQELVEAQVRRTPEGVAVVCGTRHVTYAELNRRANQLAHRLRELGVGPDVPVGACLERSVELLVAFLGILKAGGAWLPLDPDEPADRLAFKVADSAARVILSQGAGTALLRDLPASVTLLRLDTDWPLLAGYAATDPAVANAPDDIAYVIYTSGSTGQPKGALIPHRGLCNHVHWLNEVLGTGAQDRLLQTTPIGFDASVWTLVVPLTVGATIVLAEPGGQRDSGYIVRTTNEEAITLAQVVPSQLRALAAQSGFGTCQSLRHVIVGGEALAWDLALDFQRLLPATTLSNLYGATEASDDTTRFELGSGTFSSLTVPIGRPMANAQCYILDSHQEPVPIGVTGELYLGGYGLARGYLNRPALTAERFVPHPFRPGERLYRTGDFCRYLRTGDIEYLGRGDQQIKLRGFRIEVGEIEAALRDCAGVRHCVVMVREDQPGLQRLVAYVAGADLARESLLAGLKPRLPDYMVPTAFVLLDELPLLPNGKLDRQALPVVDYQQLTEPGADRAPGTALEKQIADIWTELLGLQRIGLDDDFFGLGGHSLLANRLVSRLSKLAGRDIPLRQVFDTPTIAGLAAVLDTRSSAPGTGLPGAIRRLSRQDSAPLTHTQRRVWFLAALDPESTAYNEARAYQLSGPVDVPALLASYQALIHRHEILRTTFSTVADEPRQCVQDEPAVDFTILDAAEDSLEQVLAEETRLPFDLSRGPPLRLRLVRLGKDRSVLLRVWHHIVSDGWSADVFERELASLYHAQVADHPAQLAPLAIQYADYALWQRKWLDSPALEEQLAWWQTHLTGVSTLELPIDRCRPALQSYRGARLDSPLPGSAGERLRALSRSSGTTPFMTGLAAFKVLLYRYSGTTDIAVGTPVAGRSRLELEGLIGFFANTLVLRTDLAGGPTFRQLLARVRDGALDAYTRQDVPFEKLVEVLAPARDLSRNPLFQVCFALQNLAGNNLRLPGLDVARRDLPTAHAKFDLSLDLRDRDGVLDASFEYCADLFDRETIERLAGHFTGLLDSLLADPDQCIDTVPLLSPAERHRLLVTWNDTTEAYPPDMTLAGLIEAQVRRTPDALALSHDQQSLSYSQLNTRANQLAHYLRALGVGPDVPVAICMARSIESLVGILAILKAGGAWLPLDPQYPPGRLRFMLADAAAPLVLVHTGTRQRVVDEAARVVCMDADRVEISGQPESDPVPLGGEDHLAYIIYTSGSTGTPKGVQIPRRGICNHIAWISNRLKLSAGDRVLHFTSISFDASVWEMLAPLQVGACLYVAPRGVERDMAALAGAIDREQLTILQVVPSMLRAMLNDGHLARCRSLRHIVCGGEPLDFELARRVRDQAPWVRLGNFYGPTEASIDATSLELDEQLEATGIVPIGRPIANVRCHVLDTHRQPVPIGVLGELYIGGAGLARGYVNRPELTAERFIADPFQSGERLYRTGDRVRYLPDGTLAFAGRNDDQVKIRGYRIELGEIEAALARCPGVRHAVVLAREDQPGLKRLVAYVAGEALTTESLLGQLKDRLPDYMVPTALVLLEQLPRLPNGKLDRQALAALDSPRPGNPGGYVAPGTALESLIAEVWAELLGLPRVGVHDDFFALGGHSLLAGQLASRLVRVTGVDVPLRRIFESPTVAGLAFDVEKILGTGRSAQTQPLIPVPRTGPLPLSFAQQRLWFLEQLSPGTGTYNLPTVLRLRGPLQREALRESLDVLIARHESLRTRIGTLDGEPCQTIDTAGPVALVEKNLQALGESAGLERARELAQDEAERPFDLVRGPLFRVLLIQLADGEHVLVINLHHIISDGWSGRVFDQELSALYNGQLAGQAVSLPALPFQYADYAVWQRSWLAGPVLEQQLDYWKTQLAGLATLELPIDRPRPALQSFRGAGLETVLPDALGAGLRTLGRQEGSTLFMSGLAAFNVLLYRYSGSTDIALGTPVAGRGREVLEGLIGFFANTLVLRTDLSGGPTFRQLLARVRETALGAYTHPDLPFEKLVEELAPRRDSSRNPLFQVCFAFVQGEPGTLRLSGVELEHVPSRAEQSKFDLTLTMVERGGRIRARFEYCTDLFERGTIERLAGHFGTLLAGLLANPDQSIDTVPLLSDAERHQILATGNEPALPDTSGQTLATLFEAQVRRTPDAVAVSHEGQTLTYAELNARANQLAHALRSRDIGPGVKVALCLERSPELIVGLLGIVKAGGAYVPLDPDQPLERLAFLLEDSGAQLVLTQAALLGRLPGGAGQRLCLDTDWPEIAAQSANDPTSQSSAQQLAYVIYTSGSTGTPKGVAVRQAGVIRLVIQPNYVDLGPPDTLAQVANIAFDAATFEIWGALLNGARLAILPRDTILSPPAFVAALRANRVSCLFLTTALFNSVSSAIPDAFSSLRYVLFGGEACDPDRVRAVMRASPPAHLVHVYGPTEATTFATFHVVRAHEERATIPIGRPISGTQVLLLDSHGELVPPGVVGEIYLGGPGVAAGYLNRPAETQARFVLSTVHPAGSALLYRSGDLARWLPDGALEFLGRNDDQVKIRGFRIEPAEISAVLATHPQVRASHVLARQQASGELGLTAYVVLDSSAEPAAPAALRAFLSARLPGHMVPLAFVPLTALPLTANGKVDTRALPEPPASQALDPGSWAAPRDALERTLCQVWAQVLKVERVGLDDNFFEMGGHSLLAAKLFARLDEVTGQSLTLGVLFSAPTVRQLADCYRDASTLVDEPGRALVALRREGLRPTLYFLPGIFGNVVGYADFVRALGADQPIYGLQSIGLDGRAAPFASIEAMAGHYLMEIRAQQAQGPYALVGACFGATVAYEMARQLLAAGEVVAFLGLIAPTDRGGSEAGEPLVRAPRAVRRAAALANLVQERLNVYRRDMQGQSLGERLRYLVRKVQSLSTTATQPHGLKGAGRELNQLEVYRANLQALDSYVRLPLTGPLVAFEILETQPSGPEVAEVANRSGIDWQDYWQGPLPIHVTAGKDSGDMLAGAHAAGVARVLNERLRIAFEQSVNAASAAPARQTDASA